MDLNKEFEDPIMNRVILYDILGVPPLTPLALFILLIFYFMLFKSIRNSTLLQTKDFCESENLYIQLTFFRRDS